MNTSELTLQLLAVLQALVMLLTAQLQLSHQGVLAPSQSIEDTQVLEDTQSVKKKSGGGGGSSTPVDDTVVIPSTPHEISFVSAGLPPAYDIIGDAPAIFAELSQNGIDGFFPTFQYEEVPQAKSLGHETLFLDSCTSPRAVHTAMAGEGVDLVVPLELLYENGPLPSFENDPLQAFIDCVGRDNILAVTNVDEPVHNGTSEDFVAALYQRVQAVDDTLPVLMVHAPVTADSDEVMNETQRQAYLQNVITFSQYADVIGFDVYAIPFELAKVTTPYANGEEVAYEEALEDYIVWLEQNLPSKKYLMVYQAFSISDQYSDVYIAENIPEELLELIVAPTFSELQRMVDIAQAHKLEYVIWWGQSFIKDNPQLWQDVLSVSK